MDPGLPVFFFPGTSIEPFSLWLSVISLPLFGGERVAAASAASKRNQATSEAVRYGVAKARDMASSAATNHGRGHPLARDRTRNRNGSFGSEEEAVFRGQAASPWRPGCSLQSVSAASSSFAESAEAAETCVGASRVA